MLIDKNDVTTILKSYGIVVHGVLHIGAHECEELPFYNELGVSSTNVIWIDALQNKVDEMKAIHIPNVYQSVITDKDDDEVIFHVTNNVQSSSMLDFGSHSKHHPHVVVTDNKILKTVTIDTFFNRNSLNASKYNFWNFDIQGVELMALMGASKSLQYPDAIYLEVNAEEVYRGCGRIEEIDELLKLYKFVRVKTHMTEFGWGDALYVRY